MRIWPIGIFMLAAVLVVWGQDPKTSTNPLLQSYAEKTRPFRLADQTNSSGHVNLTDAGLDHRRVLVTNALNDSRIPSESFWLLQPGLNFLDAAGRLQKSVPRFAETENGFEAAEMQYKVQIKKNLASNRHVKLTLPHGEQTVSQVVAIQYYDNSSSNAVIIATIKPSKGVMSGTNSIVFVDSFQELDADIRYTVSLDRFEQDIIFRSQVPPPESFGLEPATTDIEVITEFLESPTTLKLRSGFGEPDERHPSIRRRNQELESQDQTIDFGTMRIGRGIAFNVQNMTNNAVLTSKRWTAREGRQFLVESIPVVDVMASTADFPKWKRRDRASIPAERKHSNGRELVDIPTRTGTTFLANSEPVEPVLPGGIRSSKGYVLDYVQILQGNGDATTVFQQSTMPQNLTFKAGETYVVNGYLFLYGTTTIEGGTVIKYPRFSWSSYTTQYRIWSYGPIVCQTSTHNPAVITGTDDDRYGRPLHNTGIPEIESDGITAGRSYGTSSLGNLPQWSERLELHDINFFYQGNALVVSTSAAKANGSRDAIFNCQFISPTGWDQPLVIGSDLGVYIGNCLFKNPWCTFGMAWYSENPNAWITSSIKFQNCTIVNPFWYGNVPHDCQTLVTYDNCILDNQRDLTNPINPNQIVDSTSIYNGQVSMQKPWVAVAGGGCYIAPSWNSLLVGRAPSSGIYLDSRIRSTLSERTTEAPKTLPSQISGYVRLAPTVRRGDQGKPDYGYHYPILDYYAQGPVSVLYGSALMLTNSFSSGIVIGFSGSSAFDLGDGALFVNEGLADSRSKIVAQRAIQEEAVGGIAQPLGIISHSGANAIPPFLELRFVEYNTVPGRITPLLYIPAASGDKRFNSIEISHSEFNGIGFTYRPQNSSYGGNWSYVKIFNNFFNRGSFLIGTYDNADHSLSLDLRNNTFRQQLSSDTGAVTCSFNYGLGQLPWTVSENIFDGFIPQVNGTISKNWEYNGFTESPFVLIGVNNTITGVNYEAGPLGHWYQQTRTYDNRGGRTAAAAGLYHYTTSKSGGREGTSQVSIGYHYVAFPFQDYDGDLLPDYYEDRNGDNLYTEFLAFGKETRVDNRNSDNPSSTPGSDDLTDYFEYIYGTNPLSSDTDGDGVFDSVEIRAGTNPLSAQSSVQKRLSYWRFNNYPSFASEEGCLPTVKTADSVQSFSGQAAGFPAPGKALNYPLGWNDGTQTRSTIDLWNGSVRLTYVPNWGPGRSSVTPGAWCRLLECGPWSLGVTPDGERLVFQTIDANGFAKTNLSVTLTSNSQGAGQRGAFDIELNYTPYQSWIRVNGVVTLGSSANTENGVNSGVEREMNTAERAGGLWIGSGANGAYPCLGLIDDVETFSVPITPTVNYLNAYAKIWDSEIARTRDLRCSETAQGLLLQWTRGWEGEWVGGQGSYSISRRTIGVNTWTPIATDILTDSYTDTSVTSTPGVMYEYRINRLQSRGATASPTAFGVFHDGIRELRGNMIVVVDKTLLDPSRADSGSTQAAIDTMRWDLVKDGWSVSTTNILGERHIDVFHPNYADSDPNYLNTARALNRAHANSIKSQIQGLIIPGRLNAVYIIGHVAIPISGSSAFEDGHTSDDDCTNSDHRGGWPCDAFYGDLDGVWTDSGDFPGAVYFCNVDRPIDIYINKPGDGVFDQNILPSDASSAASGAISGSLEVGVSRIDFHYLPSARISGNPNPLVNEPIPGANDDPTERRLIRNYLLKAHLWKNNALPAAQVDVQCYCEDNIFMGLLPTSERIQNIMNPGRQRSLNNVLVGDAPGDIFENPSRVAMSIYGGYGGFNVVNDKKQHHVRKWFTDGVPTSELPNAYFGVFEGSFFVEWNHYDNDFMKMCLAGNQTMLTASWLSAVHGGSFNAPVWRMDRFMIGEPYITTLLDTFSGNEGISARATYILGDPSLRRKMITPPSNVRTVASGGGGLTVSWDPVQGSTYAVFSASSASSTTWTFVGEASVAHLDVIAGVGPYFMVKAVNAEVVGGLTYKNCSLGEIGPK